jgi:adenylate kinase
MRLLIMGPPGAGKGTQAKLIAEHYRIPAISTGDIFRANVREGTALGLEVQRIMAAGGYVSDDITNQIVADRLAQPDVDPGFLLDGYPRTVQQVAFLDQTLEAQDRRLDGVVSLQADIDEVVARLLRRAEIEGREDDTEEAIRVRQATYAAETSPLLELYDQRGLLIEVDGEGPVEDVAARVFRALDRLGESGRQPALR